MRLMICLLMCLAPMVAAAEEDRATLLLQLIRDNGCEMSEADAGDILPKHGFTRVETWGLAQQLSDAGLVDLSGEQGIKLTEKGCAG